MKQLSANRYKIILGGQAGLCATTWPAWGATRGYPGLSDLVAVRGGQVVHIEVKTPKGVQSEKQKRFQRKLEAAGGEYILARGIEDVEHLDSPEVTPL